VLVLGATVGTVHAADVRVAVLEYRADSKAAPDIAERVAALLRTQTSFSIDDPNDARRILGPGVDDQVAQCAGDASCMANIGKSMGDSEVILVGVSQLGDTVLAFQWIQTSDATLLNRVAESVSADTTLDDTMLDKYLHELLPPIAFKRFGTLSVKTNVDEASVLVDGNPVGQTPLDPLKLTAPKSYTVHIEKDGYQPFDATVDVAPDAEVALAPLLEPLQPEEGSIVGRWWFWTGVGVIAAAATSIYLVAAPAQPTKVPVTITWP
jgi:hypothetical protein